MSSSSVSESNASNYCKSVQIDADGMSADSVTETLTKSNTGSKRGRKPTNSIPPNQKIALQREAARRHKERRERYITELEKTASMLTAASNEVHSVNDILIQGVTIATCRLLDNPSSATITRIEKRERKLETLTD
ncbi:hypothetical protein BCR33DRAFT_337372 [Rhizoclosmatium globosum]|uniref:BZIP domain-containing protein n=1 Tax=Rhizoclosmatium globosum TaxID=329046 RepID=A0A1Y2C438_9FUNG|nr:hypothetical protein BCR33DRAFT_337372 [Rhizoclosmatium globosum]|eukprot:ORY41657.1 hypothetical protein BCR33DRAFT_337372 [Rhizoclosmatium globosum]